MTPATADVPPLLEVTDLRVDVGTGRQRRTALDGISFTVRTGEARGLVGESGSGKSLTLRAIMGLLPTGVSVESGSIRMEGEELLHADEARMQEMRGARVSMVFQEPSVALNPVGRVGEQIIDGMRRHRPLSRRAAKDAAANLLDRVGIRDPTGTLSAYPFELSGGMRQRVMIAAAVASGPRLILCDEPTTALDVKVQAQVLELFRELREELHAGLLYVTHDLAVVSQLCDSLTVLYGGQVMEDSSRIESILDFPAHPYSAALLAATPRIDGPIRRLESIPGTAPSLWERTVGCPFADRCPRAQADCREGRVPLVPVGHGDRAACVHPLRSGSGSTEVEAP